jgi:hypothetical protein
MSNPRSGAIFYFNKEEAKYFFLKTAKIFWFGCIDRRELSKRKLLSY